MIAQFCVNFTLVQRIEVINIITNLQVKEIFIEDVSITTFKAWGYKEDKDQNNAILRN